MMGRPGVGGFRAIHFGGDQGAGMKLHLSAEALDDLPLFDHHAVELLDLMLEMGEVGLEPGEPF
jgi:hypothetical protein